MIRSFASKETERLFHGLRSRKLPRDIQARAVVRLAQIDAAVNVEDLRLPPSNRLGRFRANERDSGVSSSMTNGASASDSKRMACMTLRLQITINGGV